VSQLKIWFAAAFALSFVAGGGAGVIADRLVGPPTVPVSIGDADAYVRMFEEQIGIESDEQRRALRAAYEQRMTDLRDLTQRIVTENREAFRDLDQAFVEQVLQQLGPEQRLRWRERTGMPGAGGPADTDSGEETPRGGGGEDSGSSGDR
jgi:hypothetical protein